MHTQWSTNDKLFAISKLGNPQFMKDWKTES